MKNLLFIMTDQQRYDTINMVQCGREVTPNLNQLAKSSMMFTRAYTTCPLCVPARTALATGVYPTQSGVVYNDWLGETAQSHQTIHTILKDSGYTVAHIGVDHVKVTPALRECGLDKFYSQTDYEKLAAESNIATKRSDKQITSVGELIDGDVHKKIYSNHVPSVWEHDIELFKDKCFFNEALSFLETNADKPFALFIYFWAPHPPFKVPQPYANMYDPACITIPEHIGEIGDGEPALRRKSVPAQLAENVSVDEWRKSWAAYLGLTTMADEYIGKLIDTLESKNIKDNTAILFTADHGEYLGQHSLFQKMEMYEDAVRVPLIINNAKDNATCVDDVVSHIDILPTVIDMLSIPTQPCEHYAGNSLINNSTDSGNGTAYIQYSGNPSFGTIRRAAVTSQYKYVIDEDKNEELYDLVSDPFEMTNLASSADHTTALGIMRDKCKSFHTTQGDFFDWE